MDSLDRQLIHALHIDGRAPFSRIAGVLGAADQTIARRFRRLRAEDALHVRGRLDARRLGHEEWVIRLRCVPGAARAIAAALARRADTCWVRLVSDGTEVLCNVRVGSERERDALLDRLAGTRAVIDVGAHCVLHTFVGGPTGWRGVAAALTAHQAAQLAPEISASPSVVLADGDRLLVAELAGDGRASLARLATVSGLSEVTVRRRIGALRASGVLYFDLDVDHRRLGYAGTALLWMSVEPAKLAAVGRALAEHSEVSFAAAISGPTNLLASVLCADVYGLYDYLAAGAGALPGVRALEVAPIIRTVKRVGTVRELAA